MPKGFDDWLSVGQNQISNVITQANSATNSVLGDRSK
jgi:hypothetical protein